MATDSRVTVVVLSFNRREEVLATTGAMHRLDGRPPIIVVDNASSDGSAAAIRHVYPGVQIIECKRNSGAAARNLGAMQATTPYVAFSDDDTRWQQNALVRAADILDAFPDIAVVAAHVRVGQTQRDDPACEPMRRSPLDSRGLPGTALLGFMAGACVMRREAFLQAGGYSPLLFIGGEEDLLALDLAALGWRMVHCPGVITYHYPSSIRNVPLRRLLLTRNAIWVAWMRLPWLDAVGMSWRGLIEFTRGSTLLRGLRATLAGLPRVLRARRVVPAKVVTMWRLTRQ